MGSVSYKVQKYFADQTRVVNIGAMMMVAHNFKWLFVVALSTFLGWGNGALASGYDFQTSDSIFKANINPNPQLAAEEFGKLEGLAVTQEEKSELMINKGLLYYRMGQMDSALIFNGNGLELAVEDEQKSRALRYRGQFFQRLDQQDSALVCLYQGRSLVSRSDSKWTSQTQLIAQTHLRLHDHDSSQYYINQAKQNLQRGEGPDDPGIWADIYDFEGQLNMYLSRFDTAMYYYSKALESFHEADDVAGQTLILGRIGGLMSFQDRDREAIPYYREAIALHEESENTFKAAELYNNLGIVYQGLNALDSAEACYRVALRTAAVSNSPRFYGNVLGNLAGIHDLQGRSDSSLYYWKASNALFSDLNDGYGLCLTNLGLGSVYSKLGQPGAAIRAMNESKLRAEALQVPALQKDTYEALFNHYKTWGPADSALAYLEQFVTIRDSINSAEVQKETDRLRIKFQSKIQEEENRRLEGELTFEVERGKQERIKFLFLGLAVLVLVASIFVVLYFRSQARKKSLMLSRAEAEHQKKAKVEAQKRLTKALQQITEKDQLLDQLEKDLREDVDPAVFADKLHERINSNQDWMQFMIEFELLYKDFFQSLNPQENKLTKNDLRLAALVKLNLSNKEIAEVQNITPDGVKKAKNRLRKKLALPPETTLRAFVS